MAAYQKILNIGANILAAGGLVGILSGCSDSRHEGLKIGMIEFDQSFKSIYYSALLIYADTDGDGFVTSAERDAFDRDLLKDKNVTLIAGSMPRYASGGEVPIETLIGWIQDYKLSK